MLINNWANEWSGPVDRPKAPVQALEVTPEKNAVWALRSWSDPDLGPATTIPILDRPEAPEDVTFATSNSSAGSSHPRCSSPALWNPREDRP